MGTRDVEGLRRRHQGLRKTLKRIVQTHHPQYTSAEK